MTTDKLTANRLATLISLVSAAPGQTLGRTAAVKLMYFLQELHGIPLGYDFRLHTYGPYDAGVLDDLDTAKTLQALTEKTVTYSVGYGYEIKPGPQAEEIKTCAADWLQANQSALHQVAGEFGSWSASDLELGATILFVDREFKAQNTAASLESIASRVCKIKPRFSESMILARVRQFQTKGWLLSIPSSTGAS